MIGAGFSTISSASDKSDLAISKSESKYVQVVVTPGESLWSIAAMVAGDSQIQSVVADIVEVNKLKSPMRWIRIPLAMAKLPSRIHK